MPNYIVVKRVSADGEQKGLPVEIPQAGAFVAAAAVPFADLTAAANAFNALRTSLIDAGYLPSA